MPAVVADSLEYEEGRLAFLRLGDVDGEQVCPYPIGSRRNRDGARVRWWTGFLDARTASRVRVMREDARGCTGR